MKTRMSPRIIHTSRTASAVCITFVATRPANSSWKKCMLCASISRWKFQRSSIGKLPASACCLNIDCSATISVLPSSTRGERQQSPSGAASTAGPAARAASQSTMRPSMANRGRLEHADHGGEGRHRGDVAAQALAARPHEGAEAGRRRGRNSVRVGVKQLFEPGEHGWCLQRAGRTARRVACGRFSASRRA